MIRLRFGFSIGPTLFWILKFGQTLSAVPFTYITTVHHPSADGSLFWDRTNFIVSISLAWHWLYWFWSSDSCLCETCFSFDLTNQQQYLSAGYILISICPDHWLVVALVPRRQEELCLRTAIMLAALHHSLLPGCHRFDEPAASRQKSVKLLAQLKIKPTPIDQNHFSCHCSLIIPTTLLLSDCATFIRLVNLNFIGSDNLTALLHYDIEHVFDLI